MTFTKRLLISAATAVMLVACGGTPTSGPNITLPDGISYVKTVAKKGGELVIPYTEYKLDNGLRIILHEDKSDPLVHVDVTYHVGSGREDVGKSGFAHFFEHMMFQGSENVADEQHFALITESGGTLNGSTNSDRTNYYQTVPSNQLEKMLWLEADRMGYFLNAVTQEKFEVQRETVKNERGQRVDNRPYGLLGERLGEAMYSEGHPYSWSVIGYLEDLDRATLDDLKKFFLRWYGPNNAVLTIGGDIDKEQTLEWIKTYFGNIPTGPAVEEPTAPPVTLDVDRYISLEDNVSLPLIYMAWPTVYANHPDEAPLDVMMSVMGEGKTSLLYKNLEKSGMAVNVFAGHGCRELHCQFTMGALPNPAKGASLAELETVMRDSLIEFEERGVEPDDLTRVKNGIVSNLIYGLESTSGKVSQLAAYATYDGDANGIGNQVSRYENVTAADVMRVYNKYIKGKSAVIMSIVPKGQGDMIAAPDTWSRYERNIPESTVSESFNWELPDDGDFDRSVIPPAGPNPAIKVPDIYKASLSNGIAITGAVNDETPTTSIRIQMKVGQTHEPLDKLGLASNLAQYLNDAATTDSSAEELSNRLDKLGSSVSFGGGDTYTTLFIRSLTKNLDETIAIALEKLMKPSFNEDDFSRLKAQTIEGIKQSKKDAGSLAWGAFNRAMYGDNNPVSWGGSGTLETVQNTTLADYQKFYDRNYSSKIASIMAVSSLNESGIKKALAPFDTWVGDDVPAVADKAYPDLKTGTVYFIDKDNAAQSEIRIGKRALPYDATGEFYRAGLMNYALGGAFNSRINLNLREDKGYTYGARSYFNGDDVRGFYVASSGVKKDKTAESIVEFVNEIDGYYQNGITQEELAFTKSAIGQRDARAYETPRQKLGFISRMVNYDLDPSFVDEQGAILDGFTKVEADALSKKHLNVKDMIMVVVGDKDEVMDDVKALGYPVVELDVDGKTID